MLPTMLLMASADLLVGDKLTICHATSSYANPYIVNTPNISSTGYVESGHNDHVGPVWYPEIPKTTVWGDIIPSYSVLLADSTIFHFPGLNWTSEGQSIYNNGCNPPPPPVPSIKVTKTCPASAGIGDPISYQITVMNTGNDDLTGIVVNDPMLGSLSFPSTLAAGDSVSKTVSYTVKPTDPNPIHNVVSVSGTGAVSGKSVSDSASCDTNVTYKPAISVTKSCPAAANVGDSIQYSITVKNTGDETLNNISVVDPMLGNIGGSFKSSLAPNESDTHTFSYTITVSDPDPIHNVVSVSGTGASSGAKVTASNTCDTDVRHVPGIKVTKSCPASASLGDKINYTITVENTGNEPLNGLIVSDPFLGNVSGSFPNSLAPGEMVSRPFTYTIGDTTPDPIHNVVTASATGADSGTQVSDTASCDTDIVHHPGIDVSKSCPATADVGATVTYSITVTNTGDETLNAVAVTDSMFGDISSSFLSPLASQQSVTKTFTHVVTDGDPAILHNEVTASGTGADSKTRVTDTASCDTNVNQQPAIKVVKGGPDTAHVGDKITYDFTVTNTGDVTLHNVTLVDPKCDTGFTPVGSHGTTMATGEVWKYTCTHTVLESDPDPLPNTVTASGVSPLDQTVSSQSSHVVDLIHPDISIVKSSSVSSGIPGSEVTYSYLVKNTGDTDLKDVSVDDNVIGHIGDIALLAAGASQTLTSDPYTLGTTDVTNIGTAKGCDALGGLAGCVEDHSTVLVKVVSSPGLSSVKTATDLAFYSGAVGDTVVYRYAVTNTGDTPLKDIKVTDDKLGPIGTIAALAAGQTDSSLTKSYVLAEADSTLLVNVGTAAGRDPLGKQVSATATASAIAVLGTCTVLINGVPVTYPAGDPRCNPKPPPTPPPPPPTNPPTVESKTGGVLPFTGSESLPLIIFLGALLTAGAMFGYLARRRREQT
jgi:uncharacterized repeat protein (TIGR01451 family)